MRGELRDIGRHGLQVAAFCAVVAVFTGMIWPATSYPRHLVYSLCIGMVTWAVMEFGRYLVPPQHCRSSTGGHGWPKGWRGLALTVAGIAAGFAIGSPLSRWLLGEAQLYAQRDLLRVLLITVAAGALASFYYHARGEAAALAAERAAAERDASEARMRLLQSQLEPHMLFNTLANLRALIGVDPVAAQRMVDRLNDYLRATLEASRSASHPLAAEFERLHDYLALMAIRMGPRLQITLELPEALRDIPVPPLILQPLVENAIQHGLEPRVAGGHIAVRATRQGERLRLTVDDTGVGFAPAESPTGRFGMAQVRERVASAYGGRGRVELQSAPGEGTSVTLDLPLLEDAPWTRT